MKIKQKITILLPVLLLVLHAALPGNEPTSSNPGAVTVITGTGALGEKVFRFKPDSGMRLGGLWIPDYNYLLSGGLKPHRGGGNNLLQLSLYLETEKLHLWKEGSFYFEFLQFNGSQVNSDAGTVQGYNSLPALPPLNRSELYQAWLHQVFFNEKLFVRIGKVVPSVDFNNVVKPLPLQKKELKIPATTGLIYTPIFVNSSMLGVLPGYYDSAYGITLNYLPTEHLYVSYGLYDGNLARGIPTGLRGPKFNGYYFQIGEIGGWWEVHGLPGNIGIGGWGQTGKLEVEGKDNTQITEKGTQGFYLFATQRLWLQHPEKDASGIIGFVQYGINNSKTLNTNEFYGGGLTFLGLIPGRSLDFIGCGFALAKLNHRIFQRSNELILQVYNQTHLYGSAYLLGALSYIPNPGAEKNLSSAWTITGRVILLF